MSEVKTVAIIGAGPVGLAAAAHVLERGLSRSCWRPASRSVTPCANGDTFNCSRPGNTTSIRPQDGCSQRRDGIRPSPPYPTGAELVERYLEPLATKTVLGAHSPLQPRHRHQPGRLRQAQDQRPRSRAIRDPLPERAGPATLRADAVIDASGTWLSPNPAGANGLRAIGERRSRPDCLRHAGRARRGARALRRQDRRRARRRPFGDRHADRSGAARGTKRRTPGRSGCCAATIPQRRSAAAPTTSSPRAANSAPAFAALVAEGRIEVESEFRRLASRRRTALASSSAPARPAAAVRSWSTN